MDILLPLLKILILPFVFIVPISYLLARHVAIRYSRAWMAGLVSSSILICVSFVLSIVNLGPFKILGDGGFAIFQAADALALIIELVLVIIFWLLGTRWHKRREAMLQSGKVIKTGSRTLLSILVFFSLMAVLFPFLRPVNSLIASASDNYKACFGGNLSCFAQFVDRGNAAACDYYFSHYTGLSPNNTSIFADLLVNDDQRAYIGCVARAGRAVNNPDTCLSISTRGLPLQNVDKNTLLVSYEWSSTEGRYMATSPILSPEDFCSHLYSLPKGDSNPALHFDIRL